MIYTVRDYYEETAMRLDAIEIADGASVSQADAGIPALVYAQALSLARRQVMQEVLRHDADLPTMRYELEWPDAEHVRLSPPDSVLPYTPFSLTMVEQKVGGRWMRVEKISNEERWQLDLTTGPVTGSTYHRFNYDSYRLALLPRPAQGREVRLTFVPLPERYTADDISPLSDREDLVLPPPVQHAVPVRAALTIASRGAGPAEVALLAAEWEQARADIERACHAHEMASPDFVRYTRDHIGL